MNPEAEKIITDNKYFARWVVVPEKVRDNIYMQGYTVLEKMGLEVSGDADRVEALSMLVGLQLGTFLPNHSVSHCTVDRENPQKQMIFFKRDENDHPLNDDRIEYLQVGVNTMLTGVGSPIRLKR